MREAKPLAILLVVLVGLVLLSATTMGGMMGGAAMGPGMMWGYGSQAGAPVFGGWGAAAAMGMGWLMMLAFWGALVVGVVLLVRWLTNPAPGQAAQEDPLAILQRRYAAGEIDEETYRRMRRDLQPTPGTEEGRDAIRRAS
jgi:putative membrane protein